MNLPEGFEFQCPLCEADRYEIAPIMRHQPTIEPPLYKCSQCSFHFSDPKLHSKEFNPFKNQQRSAWED